MCPARQRSKRTERRMAACRGHVRRDGGAVGETETRSATEHLGEQSGQQVTKFDRG
jgi:hypothetical protein